MKAKDLLQAIERAADSAAEFESRPGRTNERARAFVAALSGALNYQITRKSGESSRLGDKVFGLLRDPQEASS